MGPSTAGSLCFFSTSSEPCRPLTALPKRPCPAASLTSAIAIQPRSPQGRPRPLPPTRAGHHHQLKRRSHPLAPLSRLRHRRRQLCPVARRHPCPGRGPRVRSRNYILVGVAEGAIWRWRKVLEVTRKSNPRSYEL